MPFNQEQLNIFKKQLEDEKITLENELKSLSNPQEHGLLTTSFPSQPQEAGSPDEGMDEVEEFEANLNVHQHLVHRLGEIKAALARMQKGNFGLCEKCGQEIPLERLEANPSAATCVKCGKQTN
jgi:RNA polymerase-binding protein DksA